MFLLGLLLLCVELFVFPGIILPGIIGLTLIIAAILLGMTQHYPGDPWYPSLPAITASALRLVPSLIITVAGAMLAATFLPKVPLFNKLVLDATITQPNNSTPADQTTLIKPGLEGIAETRLNPAGVAHFDTLRLNVMSQGDFIEPGEKIVIAEVHGNRIIVERLKKS
jgi:membrane-bound serine protease (ClpP class)